MGFVARKRSKRGGIMRREPARVCARARANRVRVLGRTATMRRAIVDMKLAFTILLVVHGLIHAMGFLKAFGLARLPQLALPISRPLGALWLVAGMATLGTAVALYAWPRGWWLVGAAAVVFSQVATVPSWADAKFGTAANALVLLAVAWGFLSTGPFSLRTEFERDVARGLARSTPQALVDEQDLAQLPPPVQRYLRYVGVVGRPRVQGFRVRYSGRIRRGPTAAWMPLSAKQYSFADRPTRLFFMQASMFGLPVEALHAYVDGNASMRVKVLSLLRMVNARGPEFTGAETVTLFNDMCVMAPATLIDPAIRWEPMDATHVRAVFTAAGHTISATLIFDDEGRLIDFFSDDRPALGDDGATFTRQRWSTPLGGYRAFGPYRLASHGEARNHAPQGEYAYGEFAMENIEYNVGTQD
jgi:hypothetical protein